MSAFIPQGGDLKAWAVVVEGYGTVLEVSEELAQRQAEHYRGRGRQAKIISLSPDAEAASTDKPKLLQWNELTPGDYWAFPFTASEDDVDEGSQMVMVSEFRGQLSIDGESESGDLDESWGHYQFLPFVRPKRTEVEFQPEDLTPEDSLDSDDD